eukprot:GHUV01000625.1.p1 GENE.GHUV01000625.1~~GHUV01000625.1.p1  ORF type:complete len:924 (+),score=332.66 GHUV01000625.1:261-3032(+)
MSAAERTSLQESNVTVGKQQWSPEGRMLGAGVGAGPSYTELGLSAEPAAMSHGVTMGNKPLVMAVPTAAPAGAADMAGGRSPPRQATDAQQSAAARSGQAASSVAQYDNVRTRPAAGTSDASNSERSKLGTEMTPANRAATSNVTGASRQSQATSEPGQVQRVAPAEQQQPWYGTAWQWAKRIALGEGKGILELGPPWTKWPDYSRLNNINALVLGLWPSVSEAVKRDVVMQMVPSMMDQAVKDYGAGYLTSLKLIEFDLGKAAPLIQGLKVYDEMGEEQLMLEVAASWGSNCKVTVAAGVHVLGRSLTIPLTVQNVQFHCIVRVTARPLLAYFPYIGEVGVSLMEAPHINFELPIGMLGGLDMMALPGIYGAMRLATRLAAKQFAVYPKGIQVPLVPGGAAAGGPAGMLEVRLVRLSGLRSEDLLGQSDPFVLFRLREGREIRSKTVNNNNNPDFNETYRMLVDDPETQVLQIIVMDEDLMSFQNKVIGVAQVPMKQSACVAMPRTKVPVTLQLNKLMGPQQGIGGLLQLPIQVAGLPITAGTTGGRWLYENITGALGLTGGGRKHKSSKDRYSKVLDETGWLGPSEEYLEELGINKDQAGTESSDTSGADGMGPGCEAGPGAASPTAEAAAAASRTQTPQQPASPFGAASGRSLSPIQQQQQAATKSPFDAAAAAGTAASQPRRRRPPSEGDIRESWGSDTEADEFQSASSKTFKTNVPGGAGASGMSRLASQSAPLSAVYKDEAPAGAASSGRGAAAGPAAADNEQQQQQQQQSEEDAQKEAVKQTQEKVVGKDAKDLEGTQVKPVYRGTMYLELTYTPFKKPDIPPTGAGASPAAAGDVAAATGQGAVKPTDLVSFLASTAYVGDKLMVVNSFRGSLQHVIVCGVPFGRAALLGGAKLLLQPMTYTGPDGPVVLEACVA